MTVDGDDGIDQNSHNVINARTELGLDLDSATLRKRFSGKNEYSFANNISKVTKLLTS
jgi:hypothetical protein